MELNTQKDAARILNMLDPIALFDKTGKYVYVNEPWIKNCDKKVDLSTLSEKHAWDIVPGSRVREIVETHQSLIGEVITVDNQYAYVSYCPVFNNGEFDGVLMWELFRGEESIYKAARSSARMVTELRNQLESVNASLRNIISTDSGITNIIGKSDAVKNLKEEILAASRTNSTVLIDGETGTGKELVARAIHRTSKRSTQRFVPVNCAAIPDSLVESELFGYEEGSFTGARRGGKVGKFELADKGTLFLDEIHTLAMFAQPKILRTLQEREIDRVGGTKAIPLDFRCIAATNVDLLRYVEEEKFRKDLYYRLNVIHIHIPPLRERLEDIPLLVDSMISQLNARLNTNIIMADDGAINMLMEYDWPGNVRELQNVIEAAMNRAWDGILTTKHIRLNAENSSGSSRYSNFRSIKTDVESVAIRKALLASNGNKAEAARRLDMSRSLLYRKLKEYHIE